MHHKSAENHFLLVKRNGEESSNVSRVDSQFRFWIGVIGRVFPAVEDVHDPLAARDLLKTSYRSDWASLPNVLRRFWIAAKHRNGMKQFTVEGAKRPECSIAKFHRLLDNRIEYRRKVARRRVDDPQHLGGRGLLLQRLARLGDQPRVLHRYHGLGGEVL